MPLRTWVLLPTLVLLAACGADGETATSTRIAVATIGNAGGTLVGEGDAAGVQLTVPFGALAQNTPIAVGIDPAPPAAPAGMEAASMPLLLSPEGLELTRPATLAIPYTGLTNVQLYTAPAIEGATWTLYTGDPNTRDHLVRASITHFSRWRVFRPAEPDAGP